MERSLVRCARQRALSSTAGVGAVYDREISPSDLDGRRWRLLVCDQRSCGYVRAELSASEAVAVGPLSALVLMRVVERRLAKHPAGLVAQESTIRLRSEDFRAEDFGLWAASRSTAGKPRARIPRTASGRPRTRAGVVSGRGTALLAAAGRT